jgi:aspartyl-tRNA(Asn)/glutamyl-tRNA(Gln) amidotransferase subunit A
MYLADIYTVAISLAGLPGISIQAGKIRVDEKDLPVGLQLVGRWFGDGKLIDTARAVESIVRT